MTSCRSAHDVLLMPTARVQQGCKQQNDVSGTKVKIQHQASAHNIGFGAPELLHLSMVVEDTGMTSSFLSYSPLPAETYAIEAGGKPCTCL